jgi:hypothetical protein
MYIRALALLLLLARATPGDMFDVTAQDICAHGNWDRATMAKPKTMGTMG